MNCYHQNESMTIFWFRRDLRIEDNAGLYHALKGKSKVQCVFIFDQNILEKLEDRADPRVSFIHQQLIELDLALRQYGASLKVYYNTPKKAWLKIIKDYKPIEVYTNRDYESYALSRDEAIEELLQSKGIVLKTFKDHVIFEGGEVLKKDGLPYTVFTPYKNKWLAKIESSSTNYFMKAYPTKKYAANLFNTKPHKLIDLNSMGFEESKIKIPLKEVKQSIIKKYDEQRDFPAIDGTSKLGIHFRFGTISIREKARKATKLNTTYLSELIWRDFYSQILSHFPHVEKASFRQKYEAIPWINNEGDFENWKNGTTGYPIVDAGMRELNNTGHMHNRVRMVVASFLTKHLLIDWRWGEAYFAEKLLDFDLASNNGGWQWAAGCGTDAAPYFRIFNPTSQQKRFDPKFTYIKKWVPEFGTDDYPDPIVDHKMARERCLMTYKKALTEN